jgi:hypothetical protein
VSENSGYYFDLNAWRNSRPVRKMNWESRALYREVLDEIWMSGSIPSKIEEVAELVKMPLEVVSRAWPSVHDCLIPSSTNSDELTSERMEEERARRRKLRKIKAKLGRSGGLAKARNALAVATTQLSTDIAKTRQDKTSITTMSFFEEWWVEYPRKIGKGAARKAWDRISPDREFTDKAIAKVRESKQSADWKREHGKFIPHPATWLNQDRWEDEITIPSVQSQQREVVV